MRPTQLLTIITLVLWLTGSAAAGSFTPFSATGTIETIDTGDVVPLPVMGLFLVNNRTITGTLTGSISGPYTIVYSSRTPVPIETQSALFGGSLTAGADVLRLLVATQTGLTPVECPEPDGLTCIQAGSRNFVPGLLLAGTWHYAAGGRGQGHLTGWLIPRLSPDGHVVGIIASAIALTGYERR